jgi:putative transposase
MVNRFPKDIFLSRDTRTHLSLDKDCPESRTVHLPAVGKIIAFPEVGGLHHRYERRAA